MAPSKTPTNDGVKAQKAGRAYLKALTDKGFFVGDVPDLAINPSVRPLLDAIYVVLCGGTVTLQESATRSIQKSAQKLTKLENAYIKAINQTNDFVDYLLLASL